MDIVISFFSNPFAKGITVPVVSIILTLMYKVVSRRDESTFLTSNDVAIGLNLIVAAIACTLASMLSMWGNAPQTDAISSEQYHKALISGFFFATCVLLGFIMAFLIRKWGWKTESQTTPNFGIGILAPILVGIATLGISVYLSATK